MPDFSESHAYGNGFDREVCRGCKHEGRVLMGAAEGCGICGCPFATIARIRGGSPPESCPRLAEHARESARR